MKISLLVLRCRDIEKSKRFYECMELEFEKNKHGNGPEHYTHASDYETVVELYPARTDEPVDRTGLGFEVSHLNGTLDVLTSRGFSPELIEESKLNAESELDHRYLVRDPDGRRVEVKWAGIPC